MTTISNNSWTPKSFYVDGQLTDPTIANAIAMTAQADAAQLPPTEAAAFQQQVVNSTDLTPQSAENMSPAQIDAALNRLENAAESIVAFQQLAQNPMELISLLVEESYDVEQSDLQKALDASQAEIVDAFAQAADNEAGAQQLMSSAGTALILNLVGSALQAGGAAFAICGAVSCLRDLSEVAGESSGATGAAEQAEAAPKVGVEDNLRDEVVTNPLQCHPNPNDGDSVELDDDEVDENAKTLTNAQKTLKDGSKRDLVYRAVEAKGRQWQAVDDLVKAVGGACTAGGSYESTMGSGLNEQDQALGQKEAAAQAYEEQIYNSMMACLANVIGYVSAELQALQTEATALTGFGQAIAGARATV